ncbi:hypothetical protein GCM10022198_16820 [Klugiella xanthotipulae]|uniref:Ig-like domain-containing protein n=1 Tax=Klugiella xanthotipulae TaxID=244735 RepID=A0A543HHD6_9MICO|nr:hypothetical protein [Klugiella xanthotipulae]TQM57719.1 hypothetical protein FB466_2715 [Klugiella xanthotipulae]
MSARGATARLILVVLVLLLLSLLLAVLTPVSVHAAMGEHPSASGEDTSGVPLAGSPGDTPGVVCSAGATDTATVTVTIENPSLPAGGQLHVTGTGWCHPSRGGSVIGLKIDEGAYSHTDASLHQNRTVWALIEADATGTFNALVTLPTGSETSSVPAFAEGEHRLRLLSGSLAPGDTVRTLLSEPFMVGNYQPNGVPRPVDATTELTADTQGGVTVEQRPDGWLVTVPGAAVGDWFYLTTYVGASPRTPWGPAWFRADARGQFLAPTTGITLPVGPSRATVQSDAWAKPGVRLLSGWAEVTVAPPAAPAAPVRAAPPVTVDTPEAAPRRIAAKPVRSAAPTTVPGPPVSRASQLTSALRGGLDPLSADGVVTLTVPAGPARDWVFLYTYTGQAVSPVGWVQPDADRQVRLTITDLGAGRHKIAVLGTDGGLIGWAGVLVGTVPDVPTVVSGPGVSADSAAPVSRARTGIPLAVGLVSGPLWARNLLLSVLGVLLLAAATLGTLHLRSARIVRVTR